MSQPRQDSSSSKNNEVETREIDELSKENIANTISLYASQMLRTVALCYREVDTWPPPGSSEQDEIPLSDLADNLTFSLHALSLASAVSTLLVESSWRGRCSGC